MRHPRIEQDKFRGAAWKDTRHSEVESHAEGGWTVHGNVHRPVNERER